MSGKNLGPWEYEYEITILDGLGAGKSVRDVERSEHEMAEKYSRVFGFGQNVRAVAHLGRGIYQCRDQQNKPVGPRYSVALVVPEDADEYLDKMRGELS